jgi:hypothetical protein
MISRTTLTLAFAAFAVICVPILRGEPMNDGLIEPEDFVTNIAAAGPKSATEGPPDTLSLRILIADESPEKPVVMQGFYNIDSERAGRFGGALPGAVMAVAVLRETGAVFATRMLNDGDIPPVYQPDALPTIVQEGAPAGAARPSQLGHFTADLQKMMGLPAAAATLDAFLWLEDVASDMFSASKPAFDPDAELPEPRGAAPGLSTVEDKAYDGQPTLGLDVAAGRLKGMAQGSLVSIVAMSLPDQQIGYTVLTVENGPGLVFDVPVNAVLPQAGRGSRILAFAIAGGQRSQLVDAVLGQ